MANIDMPVLNVTASGAASSEISLAFAPKSSAGVGIDLTAATFAAASWLVNDPYGSTSSNVIDPSVSLLSASSGKVVLLMETPPVPGNYKLAINVTPSGGSIQQFALGTLQVQ